MSSALDKIKSQVRALSAYTLAPFAAPIKINQNENPFGLPAALKDEVLRRAAAHDWARYPAFTPQTLLEKLAAYAGWRRDGVMAGNGSNEMIQAVVNAVVEKGVTVVLPEPTFSVYRQVVTVAGGALAAVLLQDDLTFNAPRLREEIMARKAALAIICSPNNPTGCTISRAALLDLLGTDALIVVDQAYFEFGGDDFVPLLNDHQNLVILRTFSKAMALGGLRVGYCLAAPELIVEFNKAKMPYSLNFFSLTAAEAALDNIQLLRPLVEQMQSEQQRLFAELQKIEGLLPAPSAANFFAVKTALPPKQLFQALHARGILIRDVSSAPLLEDYVRISVGTPEENEALLDALRQICAS